MEQDFKLDGNGHQEADVGEETQEELRAVAKNLSAFTGKDGSMVSLTKQDIGLLKSFVHAPDKADDFIRIVQICDFIDEEEANRELDAFYEAVRLGMDTNYNIAHALSRASANRKGSHVNSRVAKLMDTLSHQKLTSNMPRKGNDSTNPRSPIA